MQPLGTKKNYLASQDKNRLQNLLGQKEIRQSLKTKKNYATSWDKRNHATSRDKKIMQPSGTTK